MGDFSLDTMNDMYMDVLKELGNIGAGNATTALAQLLNMKLDMRVPKVELLEFNKLAETICGEEDIVVGIYLFLEGDINGSMMFMLEEQSSHILVNHLMGRDTTNMEPFNEQEENNNGKTI